LHLDARAQNVGLGRWLAVSHRRAQQLRLGARGLRHGGQSGRVGGGLGAKLDELPGLGQRQQ